MAEYKTNDSDYPVPSVKEQERMVKEDPQFFFIDTPVGEIGGHVRQGFPNQKFNQTANKNK